MAQDTLVIYQRNVIGGPVQPNLTILIVRLLPAISIEPIVDGPDDR